LRKQTGYGDTDGASKKSLYFQRFSKGCIFDPPRILAKFL